MNLAESALVPTRATASLFAYRRWAVSDMFPQQGHFFFLDGELWVDMSPEQLFTHNQVKKELSRVVSNLMARTRVGRFFPDGCLVTNVRANLSTEPDGTLVLHTSFREGRIRLVKNKDGPLELVGTPDLVIEVVSTSSIRKDTRVLRELYWRAQIPEYWLVDAREDRPQFDLLRWTRRGYVATPAQGGWRHSPVLEKDLRIRLLDDPMGPDYKLMVR